MKIFMKCSSQLAGMLVGWQNSARALLCIHSIIRKRCNHLDDKEFKMKKNITIAVLAMLGVFGTGRWAEVANANGLATGAPSTSKSLPPIDAAAPSKVETVTFALG